MCFVLFWTIILITLRFEQFWTMRPMCFVLFRAIVLFTIRLEQFGIISLVRFVRFWAVVLFTISFEYFGTMKWTKLSVSGQWTCSLVLVITWILTPDFIHSYNRGTIPLTCTEGKMIIQTKELRVRLAKTETLFSKVSLTISTMSCKESSEIEINRWNRALYTFIIKQKRKNWLYFFCFHYTAKKENMYHCIVE